MLRILALALVFLMLASGIASAHAPTKVDLEFTMEDHLLHVSVQHQVKDQAKHHVSYVTVDLNDGEIIRQTLDAQEGLEKQELVYRITDAKIGDTISVTAACNISGKKKASIKIAPPPKETKE
jgi:desulfoferrodoxin (superoxide reductase-like protein)